MSDDEGGAAKDSGRLVCRAELHAANAAIGALEVERFVVIESQLEGWTGYARVDARKLAPQAGRAGLSQAFRAMIGRGCFAGRGVSLGLWVIADEAHGAAARPLRRWPSVVTRLTATTDRAGDTFVHVHFSDLVTYLGDRPVWGVFKDCRLAEAVGGAVSMALGADGTPTTAPSVDEHLPPLVLSEQLRDTLDLPFVVAAGDTLGTWLGRLLGRVGVRMEMLGTEDGVAVCLKDGPPSGTPVPLALGAGRASALNAVLRGTRMKAGMAGRDAVLDNPSTGEAIRVTGVGAVSTLITGSGTDFEEATYRAGLREQFDEVAMAEATVVTGQSGILPGRRVAFDAPVSGALVWQAGLTQHGFLDGAYLNTLFLVKDGVAWRPRMPDARGATLVTGLVDDGTSEPGAVVPRDRLGRIPVSLHVDIAVPEGETGTAAAAGAGRGLRVPVVDPLAGGMHGFVSEHRQGDRCRLAVNNPLDVEVVGFLYDDHRPIADRVSDGSMGIIVGHDSEAWSGVLFRPDAEDDKDWRGDEADG